MSAIIEIKNLVKRYGEFTALAGLNLSIPKGSIFGLLGPNGAGKTSLIRIITQITAPDEGQVFFNGEPLSPKHIASIGYLPEERGLYKKAKVGEQLLYFAQLKGMSHAEAMEKIKDWFIRLDIKEWWHKNVEELSKGMAQKVQFISTVLHEPEFIILDEPFSGFDPVNSDVIRDEIIRLNQKGATILFSTHRMDTVEELCTHLILIDRAEKLLDGSTKDIRNQFKSNSYQVVTDSPIETVLMKWRCSINNLPVEEGFLSVFHLDPEERTAALLQQILQQANVLSFKEEVPSFHDIFVKVVTQQHKAA